MNRKKFYLETVGCQMNILDSELAAAALITAGYQPAPSAREADVVLFNTCSVREHAEEKIYSALGRLKHWKEDRPGRVLGVMGCMAQKDREIVFRRAPHVDLVLGPGRLDALPALIADLLANAESRFEREKSKNIKNGHPDIPVRGAGRLEVSRDRFAHRNTAAEIRESFRLHDPIRLAETRPRAFQAMVRIMFGCDKFCSYCVVPQVRGPEQGRNPADILREIETLAGQGCREVVLLGQTVNSYRFDEEGKRATLASLLEKINEIEGIERIRFVSNYPTGMTDQLLEAVRDLPKVMPHLHVPAQHGSDAVLKRMRRQYSVADYRELLERIAAMIPGVAVTSDFIVGFCGETEEEFQETVELVRFARFKNSFIFKYSPRPGTKSAEEFADDVSETDKRRRNNELLDVQNEISKEANRLFLGQTVEILVEGPSKTARKTEDEESASRRLPLVGEREGENLVRPMGKDTSETVQMTGRTPCDRIVVFDGSPSLAGTLQKVRVVATSPFTLFAETVSEARRSNR